jgi:hypothetical protein
VLLAAAQTIEAPGVLLDLMYTSSSKHQLPADGIVLVCAERRVSQRIWSSRHPPCEEAPINPQLQHERTRPYRTWSTGAMDMMPARDAGIVKKAVNHGSGSMPNVLGGEVTQSKTVNEARWTLSATARRRVEERSEVDATARRRVEDDKEEGKQEEVPAQGSPPAGALVQCNRLACK